ncbi:MAG: hypothetical protein M1821_004438 [Bathelium mastoideum]|nr:MAG: hypothetical protein M1821_004438 [Bathelium mastoideum]
MGLTAAITFQRYGHNVTILEASHTDLEHQAAGIGTALPLQQFFDHFDRSTRPYSLPCTGIIHIDQLDRTVNRAPISMRMSSWDSLYYRLRWNFDGLRSAYEPTEPEPLPMSKGHPRGNALYRKGHRFTGLDVQGGQVTAYFEDSRGASGKLSGDILIGADGANSMVRKQMLGHDNPVRRYAGYVLWRGLVKETEVTEHTRNVFEGHFTFLALKRQYLIWSVRDSAYPDGLCSDDILVNRSLSELKLLLR